MRAQGFHVHVMTSPGNYLQDFARAEGATAHAVRMERRITPFRDLLSVLQIRKAIRKIRPDIVHASTPKGGLLGTIAARLAGVPVVIYHIRGLAFTGGTGLQRTLLKTTERIAARLAHKVLCVSQSVRAEAVAERIVPFEKTVVLGSGSSNGVAASSRFNPESVSAGARNVVRTQLGIPNDAVVIGFVGRLVRDKGVVELADAWETVAARHPNSWLLIVGPWETRDPVPEQTRRSLDRHPRVIFAGEREDMAPLYCAMDLVVLPTYREGFPNVPLEASAMNLPVIATRVTGCVDAVVDGITGTLVTARDPDALSSAMSRYIEDADLRKNHGRAGRRRVLSDFTPESVWDALRQEYLHLLAERK